MQTVQDGILKLKIKVTVRAYFCSLGFCVMCFTQLLCHRGYLVTVGDKLCCDFDLMYLI